MEIPVHTRCPFLPRRTLLRAVLVVSGMLCCLGTAGVASAQIWTSHGPEGGPISGLLVAPNTPTTLYAVCNGLFNSNNGAGTWTRVHENYITPVVDPTTPTTLYAVDSNAIVKSTDGGANWSVVLKPVYNSAVLVIDPTSPTTLYAGAGYKTTDGGSTWTSFVIPSRANVLAIDPTTPTTLYAGTDKGILKSTDRGDTWGQMGLTDRQIGSLAIDPTTPTTLYAGRLTLTLLVACSRVPTEETPGAPWAWTGPESTIW